MPNRTGEKWNDGFGRSAEKQNSTGAACSIALFGLTEAETEEFKKLGSLTLGKITEKQWSRYRFLCKEVLDIATKQ